MSRPVRPALAAAVLALLAACGGGGQEGGQGGGQKGGEVGGGPAVNTVAGCTAATIDKIINGDLADTNGPDDPACQGLSDADVMKAGADAFADPKVKAYMADLIAKGGGGQMPSAPPEGPMAR